MKECLDNWSKLQSEIGALVKDTKGYNYQYADLNQVLDLVMPACEANGFLIYQDPANTKDGYCLKTDIIDKETGNVFRESLLPLFGDDPQKLGASLTYMRRYALIVMFNLKTIDNDGKSEVDKDGLTKPQRELRAAATVSYKKHLQELSELEEGCSIVQFNDFRNRAKNEMYHAGWNVHEIDTFKKRIPEAADHLGFELTDDGKSYITKQRDLEEFTK